MVSLPTQNILLCLSVYEQCKPGLAQKAAAPRPTTELNGSSQERMTSADPQP